MENSDIYSERTLRYGRNINFICFLTIAMNLMDVDLSKANLFGATTSEQNIWIVLSIMLGYQFFSFLFLGRIDWIKWKMDFPALRAESSGANRLRMMGSGVKVKIQKSIWPLLYLKNGWAIIHENTGDSLYGWLIKANQPPGRDDSPSLNGSFVVNKDDFKKCKMNYFRWVFMELGLPTFLAIGSAYLLFNKISY